MLTRSIGTLFRGKTTAFQVMAASTLGCMLGFLPSFEQTPALSIALVVLLMVLNANLFVAGLALLFGMAASVVLMPASFQVGRLLLDGPTRPVFEAMINAPVLALFGLEYYVVPGGLVIGGALGLAVGFLLHRLITRFRRRMAAVETDERYQTWSQKGWVKAVSWLLLGGRAKGSYAELAARSKLGNPVRPLGAAAAVLLLVLVGLVYVFLAEPLVTAMVVRGLERANGATVDLDSAELDLGDGRLTLTGLAMADPNALDTDLFRAATINADVSAADLLRRRLALDDVVIANAYTGVPRERRGQLVGRRPEPPEDDAGPGEKTLEDYVDDAKRWKRRLTQAREWLDRVSGRPDEAEPGTVKDWLKQQVALRGYSRVRADHLLQGAPTLLIRHVAAEGVVAAQLDGETLDIEATNLSTHPSLTDEPPRVTVRSSKGTLVADLSAPVPSRGHDGALDLALRGLAVDGVAGQLRLGGGRPVEGGTYDLHLDGGWSPWALDLPLRLTLHDATLAVPGAKPRRVGELPLTVNLTGPMNAPSLRVDRDQLAKALVDAGLGEVAGKVRGEADRVIDEALGEGAGKAVGDKLKGFLDRNKRGD